jgi:effector-binding domain-containing protein
MQTNQTPIYDGSDNPTGCCPRFKEDGWDRQTLHFEDKRFVRANTISVAHVPLNMGKVFARVFEHIDAAGADSPSQTLVMSRDLSGFSAEHLFAVTRDVPDEDMTMLSGDYLTSVFEGPYSEAATWHDQMKNLARARGHVPGEVWFFYTTCPKCAKVYGKNPVVGVVQIDP